MSEAGIAQETANALFNIEAEINERFKTMLANDAMLTLEMELHEAKSANFEELQSTISGPALMVLSSIEWNENSGRHVFLLREEEANALVAQITAQNEALDSLDVVFANWNVGAGETFQEKLANPPTFGEPQLETRPLNAEDVQEGDLLLIYQLKFDGSEYPVYRIASSFWQQMADAAGLEVTAVEDLAESLPDIDPGPIQVENVKFDDLNDEEVGSEAIGSLEMLYDLKLDLVVELGRTKKPIREILELARGSIVELDKLAGDPVEIYVNDRKLAEGEVVVVDDHFGVRVTNLLKPSDRIKSLGSS
ncbi:MAG: flagellar motor switch protein FliN [Calditrichaeota bacterium]|nr:MAG: flagellar motor switch protein FliN [Calditrichota bacterium]